MPLSSMAFLRLFSSQVGAYGDGVMTPAEAIRAWMKETMAAKGLGPTEWADKAKVARSTVFRALKDDYQFKTSTSTLAKLASAAEVAAPGLPVATGPVVPEFLTVRYEVGAGLWRRVDDVQAFFGTFPVAPDPAYAGVPQWLERVVGDSMDKEYRPGELVHVVDAAEIGYAPRPGDHVILQMSRAEGQEVERTVKEYQRGPKGEHQFWPRSTSARWQEPITVHPGLDQTFSVEVVGLVIGSYRPRR